MSRRHVASLRSPGAVALSVALAMALAMLLFVAMVHAALLTEQRLSANRYRAAVAFEAADAGIDWMIGRLNAGNPVDASCNPEPSLGRPTFREEHAGLPDAHGAWRPQGVPVTCTAEGPEWACRCERPPFAGMPSSTAQSSAQAAATFAVKLLPGTPADLLRAESVGCSNPAPPCAGASGHADAQARVAITIGHVPALAQLPTAALTVRGDLHLGASPWVLQHAGTHPPGLALHTGGTVDASRLTTQGSGSRAASMVLAEDASLRRSERGHVFAQLFRMDIATWQALPTVRRVDCASACDSGLREALGRGGHHRMLWLKGGLHLAGHQQVGTPERPVLIVADGPVSLAGPVTVHGLIYTTSSSWQAPAGVEIVGAVVAEGALQGSGPTLIRHDTPLLRALHERTGTFVRVPGSWKDFE